MQNLAHMDIMEANSHIFLSNLKEFLDHQANLFYKEINMLCLSQVSYI